MLHDVMSLLSGVACFGLSGPGLVLLGCDLSQ